MGLAYGQAPTPDFPANLGPKQQVHHSQGSQRCAPCPILCKLCARAGVCATFVRAIVEYHPAQKEPLESCLIPAAPILLQC
jgi:hypothetical protein